MTRGIVYVGGGSRHWIEQSAALVADRIARSLQDALLPDLDMRYRITVKTDANVDVSGVGVDIASIEIAKGEAWEAVIDVLEVKYLPAFIKRFNDLRPAGRALKGLAVLVRSVWRVCRAHCAVRGGGRALGLLDLLQAYYMFLAAVVSMSSLIYWIFVGALAVMIVLPEIVLNVSALFGSGLPLVKGMEGLGGRDFILMAALLLLVTGVREIFLTPLETWAVEIFSMMEYQFDDSKFLVAPNAILNTIEFANQRGYTGIDLLTFSLGALLTTDTIFPRNRRPALAAPDRQIGHWITLGLPYDLIRASYPGYFSSRMHAVVNIESWMNIVIRDDFLGTDFTHGSKRGIKIKNCQDIRTPDINPPPLNNSHRRAKSALLDLIPFRRMLNHRLYWDDRDASARTCFSQIAGPVGWVGVVRDALRPGLIKPKNIPVNKNWRKWAGKLRSGMIRQTVINKPTGRIRPRGIHDAAS